MYDTIELYNLHSDPSESTDLSQTHPEIVELLLNRLRVLEGSFEHATCNWALGDTGYRPRKGVYFDEETRVMTDVYYYAPWMRETESTESPKESLLLNNKNQPIQPNQPNEPSGPNESLESGYEFSESSIYRTDSDLEGHRDQELEGLDYVPKLTDAQWIGNYLS